MKENLLLLRDLFIYQTYKHVTVVSKNVHNKLDEILGKYNTYCKAIRMKPADVKSGAYIEYGIQHHDKDPKFKVGDHVKTWK